MNAFLVGAVTASLLFQPIVAAAQAAPGPLLPLPTRISIERAADGPLMTAIRRQGVLMSVRAGERAAPGQPPSAVPGQRSWIGRHPVLFGALIGAGAGTLAAGTMNNELFCQAGNDEDCFFYNGSRFAVGAGIGAGIGALAGWIVGLGRR